MIEFHPSLPFFAAAFLAVILPGRLRQILQLAVPLISFAMLRHLTGQGTPNLSFSPLPQVSFELMRLDPLALFFVYAFLIFAFLANGYALHVKEKWVHVAANLYAGSSIGAVLAGDLAVLFVFWEIMAAASCVLIWNKARKGSLPALLRYALVHLAGGLFLFAGILLRWIEFHTLSFGALEFDAAGWLIFTGFCVNAAVVPLHAWLPDAYPEGTPAGSVYLSAFTTKVAVYAFARAFMGADCLVWLGIISAFYGVIFALMENDMRRLLSYHIVCQVGYMLCGIGLGSEIGVNGAAAHAVGNIFFKGLLFMAVGAVIHRTGKYRLNELGGIFSKNRLIVFLFMIGALAISGFPFLNGYISKSILVKAAGKSGAHGLELGLLMVAAGTFMSIALKLAYFAFWGESNNKVVYKEACPVNMYAAMIGAALLCFGIGIWPAAYFLLLPYPAVYDVYSHGHVLHTLQLLAGVGIAFGLILPKLHVKAYRSLDTDWFYREGARIFLKGFCQPVFWTQSLVQSGMTQGVAVLEDRLRRIFPRQTFAAIARPVLITAAAALVIGMMMIKYKGLN